MAAQGHTPGRDEPQLLRVATHEEAEVLVASGVDSRHIVIADEEHAEQAMARAAAGLAADRGPLPLQPFDFGVRSLVVLPTYNERANIEPILRDILAYLVTDVLVVDDGSPDGTGEVADRLAANDPRIKVLHRERKLGLGTAYIAGFRQAIDAGYDRVFEMDADFSHPPWDLPRLAAASAHAELVIGSRYVSGGNTTGWDLKRRLLSRGANLYARTVLAPLSIHDSTAGYRCYHTAALARLDLDKVRAEGYAFQVEMAYRMVRAGFRVLEIPIHFCDRLAGASKMDSKIAYEAVRLVPSLRFRVPKGEPGTDA